MTTETLIAKGVVHGKTIKLDQESGLPDGVHVLITMQTLVGGKRLPPGEGIKRSAGAWSDDADGLDQYLNWNRQQRKQGRRDIES
jgi:hypothetical protein